jgi:hypothetical protein
MPPTVTAQAATTAGSTASATPSVLMPATVNPGDRIVAAIRVALAGAIGWPGGWTEFFDEALDASDDQYSCAWTTAVGTEDGTSITLSSANAKYSAISIALGAADPPECGTRAVATSVNPNPPSFSPSGGSKDYMWLWFGCWEGEQTGNPPTAPTNYANGLLSTSGTAGVITTNTQTVIYRRSAVAATEDPAQITISASDDWAAWVVAVPPETPAPDNIARFGAMPAMWPDRAIMERRVW